MVDLLLRACWRRELGTSWASRLVPIFILHFFMFAFCVLCFGSKQAGAREAWVLSDLPCILFPFLYVSKASTRRTSLNFMLKGKGKDRREPRREAAGCYG
jgi:hypothetical protein